MGILEQWAAMEGVGADALARLAAMYAADSGDAVGNGKAESYVQSAVRLEAPHKGVLLMRNNVGALKDDRGVPVRYGLMNDSSQLNKRIKSSDLIGMRRVLITQQHVGRVIGQFVARECKHDGWVLRGAGDAHEHAQMEFLNLVNSWGGDGKFASGPGTM